jgi:hypothetical protein
MSMRDCVLKIIIIVIVLAAWVSFSLSQETLEMTSPASSESSVELRVATIIYDFKADDLQIRYEEIGEVDVPAVVDINGDEITAATTETVFVEGGQVIVVQWTGEDAHSLIADLNKANFSSTSMVKTITVQAQEDDLLGSGDITGSPE